MKEIPKRWYTRPCRANRVTRTTKVTRATRATRVTRGIWDSFYVHSTLHQVKTIFHLTIKTYFFVSMDSGLHIIRIPCIMSDSFDLFQMWTCCYLLALVLCQMQCFTLLTRSQPDRNKGWEVLLFTPSFH